MSKSIKVKIEVILTSDLLTTGELELGKEIKLDKYDVIVSVNRLPFYKGKLKNEDNLLLCKIISVFESEEALNQKEKYLL
ncbi:hypothetical protein SAMN06265182_0045 [Persephonella hydrogeniphila]|uniref:Flagellar motor switch protein FliN/FliY n=1 Tax=Persephonella hydrogeniphila TaxID=198703 RepID=A0A285MZU7_9AQUI|nr:hypothetical protein [Persephonella hydrogeniphila]SNZ02193.1 hypothetical protein SAMN06265182_0045 [Persephonella hydrogeniphila]